MNSLGQFLFETFFIFLSKRLFPFYCCYIGISFLRLIISFCRYPNGLKIYWCCKLLRKERFNVN